MSYVNFNEIATPLEWEFFAEAFFIAKGKNIILGPSTGGDGGTGKDLIIEEILSSEFGNKKRKILVSCKHYSKSGKSVNADDENDNIFRNVFAEGCNGFLGFYSTWVSSPLQKIILDLKKHESRLIEISHYYDSASIEAFLLYEDKENSLLKRFFPDSYKEWKNLSIKDAEQNPNFKKLTEAEFKSENNEYFKKFYEGQPAHWSIIRKHTFKRDCFDSVIEHIENNKVCLITGAGGEGKTTLLMQIGEYYLKKDCIVLYSFDSITNLELGELRFKPDEKYLIIIDNANEIKDLSTLVQKVKLSKNTLLLIAARKNEWDYSFQNRDNKRDLSTLIGKPINLIKLSDKEVMFLSRLLQKNKILNEEVKEKLIHFINNSKNSTFLLAVMVYATQGKSFDLIIKDVIDKIRDWKDSEKTIEAIGYIVCLEVLGRGSHGQIYCQESLLKKLLNIVDFEQYQTIKKHLSEEAFFQGSLRNTINTRNPIIAKIYYDYLFENESPILDKYSFYYNIIKETSFLSNAYSTDVRAMVPKYFIDKDEQTAIQLLKDAVSYGFFWNTFYPFIDLEVSKENVGQYNSDQYSARWLLEKAYEKNSNDPGLYKRWSRFEIEHGEIGQVNYPFTTRWILRKGTEIINDPNLYVIWANLEAQNDNIGTLINGEFKEYTARWICSTGIEKTQDPNLYVTWANIEAKKGNRGTLINGEFEEYSARWICNSGIEKTHDPNLYVTWANIETKKNIGKLVNGEFEKYSARWICNSGIEKTHDPQLYIIWAKIEADNENIGDLVNEEFEKYTARWICNSGIEKTHDPNLYVTWANIEAKKNIGKLVNGEFEKYSARWICNSGIEKTHDLHLYITWAKIEADNDNIGEFIGNDFSKYSARWILREGFNKTRNKVLLTKWIKLELSEDNLGTKDDLYTAEWIYSLYKTNFGLINNIQTVIDLKNFFDQTTETNSV